jgi:hypothetical protein
VAHGRWSRRGLASGGATRLRRRAISKVDTGAVKNSPAVVYDEPRLSVSEEERQPVSALIFVDPLLAPRRQAAVANMCHHFFRPDTQDAGNQVGLQLKAGC